MTDVVDSFFETAQREAAEADLAAQFFHELQFHVHVGVWDGEDKIIIYDTRGGYEREPVVDAVDEKGWRYSVGTYDDAWAVVIYNYQRDSHVFEVENKEAE